MATVKKRSMWTGPKRRAVESNIPARPDKGPPSEPYGWSKGAKVRAR